MRGLPSCASVLASALLVGFVAGGCSSASDSTYSPSSGANTGSGASSGQGSGGGSAGSSTYVPPSCDEGCQDFIVAWGVTDTIWFLWNQKITGTPVGAKDISGSCPLGGEVHITGTTELSSDQITSLVDLEWDFSACENADEIYDLAFTGIVTMEGTFISNTDFTAMTYSTTSLETGGVVHYYDDPEIDDVCDMNFAQDGSGDAFSISGRRCGRMFSERSLEVDGAGGTSSGGSGGSGNTGGSGNSCMCFCPNGTDCTNATDPNPCGLDADGIPEACGCPVDCP